MLVSVNVIIYYVDLLSGRVFVLLQLRDQKKGITFPGYWAIPGGSSKGVETPERAVEREIFEETSLRVNKSKLTVVKKYPKDFFPWLKKISFFYSYQIDYETSLSVENGEGQKMSFFNIDEIDGDKMPPEQFNLIRKIGEMIITQSVPAL